MKGSEGNTVTEWLLVGKESQNHKPSGTTKALPNFPLLVRLKIKYWGDIHKLGLRSYQGQIKCEKKVSSEPADQITILKVGIT